MSTEQFKHKITGYLKTVFPDPDMLFIQFIKHISDLLNEIKIDWGRANVFYAFFGLDNGLFEKLHVVYVLTWMFSQISCQIQQI